MNFKVKKVRKKIKEKPVKKEKTAEKTSHNLFKISKRYTISLPIVLSLIVMFSLVFGIFKAISSIDFTVFLEIAGEELEQDSFGHTNFLLLGTGTKDHDGGNLTDTIMVASLDRENKLVTMLSIPRDLYVDDELVGSSKINENYFKARTYYDSSTAGIEHMKERIEEIVGVPIHYWVKINFDGFKDLVDAIGGVDIDVPEAIYDPYYPKDGTYEYEPFSIAAGPQHLDGETALKYARSRKTTSDFDRAARQQQIIYAIKEQALATDVILSQQKIKSILSAIKANIETNIKVKEILTLGSFADEFTADQIAHRLIHDDPTQCGGFVYTPIRQYYGGQFVLIPAGGPEFLHLYSDLSLNTPNILPANDKLHILNGTPTAGVAGETKQVLQRFCFDVVRFGNARSNELNETPYHSKQRTDENGDPIESEPISLVFLQKIIPGKVSTDIPQEYIDAGYFTQANLVIEIGSDYTQSPDYLEDPFYYLPDAMIWSTPASTETTTETTSNETE